jgi:hypothetical protein
MRKALWIVLGLALGSTAQTKECERFDSSDLKAMPAEKLKLHYCLNAIEIHRQSGRQQRAAKAGLVEAQSPVGASRREIARLDQVDAQADSSLAVCRAQNERIMIALGQKKANKVAIMKECPSSY